MSFSLKDMSDDEGSSVVSDSIPSGEFLSSYPIGIQPEQMTASNLMDLKSSSGDNHLELSQVVPKVASYTADDVAKILCELQSSQTEQNQLQSTVESLKVGYCLFIFYCFLFTFAVENIMSSEHFILVDKS